MTSRCFLILGCDLFTSEICGSQDHFKNINHFRKQAQTSFQTSVPHLLRFLLGLGFMSLITEEKLQMRSSTLGPTLPV